MPRSGNLRPPHPPGAQTAPPASRIRFELEPENRNLSDHQLIADLRRVARLLQSRSMTMTDYIQHGHVAAATIARRFGGWNTALAAAKLSPVKKTRITADQLIADLQRVARLLKCRCFSRQQYKIHGRFGTTTVERFFGTWTHALNQAGMLDTRTSPSTTEQELFDNLESLWLRLGRQPRGSDICKPLSRYNLKTYKNRYGGIRAALRAFVQYKKTARRTRAHRPAIAPATDAAIHTTPRNVNWRLRYLILRRDHFRCRACGRSPANDPAVHLQIDHIIPWSAGGETVQSNLQTLCSQCNGGKSNLT